MKKKRELFQKWLIALRVLAVICLVIGIICTYRYVTGTGTAAPMALFFICAVMFFMAYLEKSKEALPGSPEYIAKERAREAKIEAHQEQLYKKQHPFEVARHLVDENKTKDKTGK